ncbi:NAD(P)-dependent alcohol dehydrogenase [Rapidithrix thailandica]
MMKAVFCTQYGSPEVLEVRETPLQTPGKNEVVIQNYASSITTADTFLRRGIPKFSRLFLGLRKPKNPRVGTGFAGVITQLGSDVTNFQPGDKVYGETSLEFGANAEYVCVNTQKSILQPLPEQLSFEEAAPLCDGILTSYNFLVDAGKLQRHQHVLINGAAGALGIAAVQIAKSLGARVTAVCSAKNAAWVKSLGADETIDYQKSDFTENLNTYDMIFDAVGKSSYHQSKKALKKAGKYLSPVLTFPLLLTMMRTSLAGQKKAIFQATGLRKVEELNRLLKQIHLLIQKGELKIVVDKTYPLDRIKEAHQYVDSGHKKGNIVLTFHH